MNITVRHFISQDAESFRLLHRECMSHYKIPPATQAQENRVISHLIAERHMACHLAFADTNPVGFATWGLSFPAGTGISLVMKELFVSPKTRSLGVGKALLSALIDTAREEHCERLDWATDGNNAQAQAFYKAIGAAEYQKTSYRIAQDDFDTFQATLDK